MVIIILGGNNMRLRNELAKIMKDNKRCYIEFGFTKITLYTREMLKKNEWIFVDKEYKSIDSLVTDLRQHYIVNYIKDSEGILLVRNKKNNY